MFRTIFLSLLSILSLCSLSADVKLPNVLADNMVLQRGETINIWGWAEANEKVSVSFAGKTVSTTAGADGSWKVELAAQKANKTGQAMTIKGKNEISLKNILIGDIWLGSGQSNMEWGMNRTADPKAAIAAADHPLIRLFHVKKVQKPAPEKDVVLTAPWRACQPSTVAGFSGVLYYFGRKLIKDLDVPIGLINSSWGGSPIEPWFAKNGKMYNAMIAPLHNFKIKGLLWYQGETNVIKKNGLSYFDKKKELIEGWRAKWGNDKLPFYFVQIAPWSNKRYADGQLPALWEAQVKTLTLPHTGMAVTTDIVHNLGDIHPKNKLDVGERLARWALVKNYGKKLVYSGPLFKSQKIEGNKIRLSFVHTGSGLLSRDGKPLTEFQIAGEDGNFVDAKAVIDDDTVVVSSDSVKAPTQVRFGWHRACNPNLMNKEKLPASPFQSNNWQGGTGE